MSPELMNLGISLLLFGLIALLWQKCFARPTYGGRGVSVSTAYGGAADKLSNLVEIGSEEEFSQRVKGDGLTVVDWTATWCGPCQMIAPFYEELARKNPNVTFLKVDLDRNRSLAGAHGIKSVPTFSFFKRGVKVDSLTGNNPEGLSTKVSQFK